jgi:hypothetical protein
MPETLRLPSLPDPPRSTNLLFWTQSEPRWKYEAVAGFSSSKASLTMSQVLKACTKNDMILSSHKFPTLKPEHYCWLAYSLPSSNIA